MSTTYTTFQPQGILDNINGEQLRQEVKKTLEQKIKIVLINFQEIKFINSHGLGILCSILKEIRAHKGHLFICSLTEEVKLFFEITQMNFVFKPLADRNEFMQIVEKLENN